MLTQCLLLTPLAGQSCCFSSKDLFLVIGQYLVAGLTFLWGFLSTRFFFIFHRLWLEVVGLDLLIRPSHPPSGETLMILAIAPSSGLSSYFMTNTCKSRLPCRVLSLHDSSYWWLTSQPCSVHFQRWIWYKKKTQNKRTTPTVSLLFVVMLSHFSAAVILS